MPSAALESRSLACPSVADPSALRCGEGNFRAPRTVWSNKAAHTRKYINPAIDTDSTASPEMLQLLVSPLLPSTPPPPLPPQSQISLPTSLLVSSRKQSVRTLTETSAPSRILPPFSKSLKITIYVLLAFGASLIYWDENDSTFNIRWCLFLNQRNTLLNMVGSHLFTFPLVGSAVYSYRRESFHYPVFDSLLYLLEQLLIQTKTTPLGNRNWMNIR